MKVVGRKVTEDQSGLRKSDFKKRSDMCGNRDRFTSDPVRIGAAYRKHVLRPPILKVDSEQMAGGQSCNQIFMHPIHVQALEQSKICTEYDMRRKAH